MTEELQTKPRGVRIVRPDGTEIPCEIRYLGRDDDGIDCWKVLTEVPFRIGIDRLAADELPARTSLQFDVDSGFPCDSGAVTP